MHGATFNMKKWAYYNENDPKAAAWIRELIAAKLIMEGEVDGRSIAEVQPNEVKGFLRCHWFAGIAGWEYALRLAGWPDDGRVTWTGSCPCQPISCAGLRQGHADERHLWPAFYELIAECQPATIFGEQVAGPDGREWLAGIRADLEGSGYAVGAADLCAACLGAPHIRQRLFWVANAGCVQAGWSTGSDSKKGGRSPIESSRCGDAGWDGCAWDRFDILHCRDGKARRVGLRIQWLVDGIQCLLGDRRSNRDGEAQNHEKEKITAPVSEGQRGQVRGLRIDKEDARSPHRREPAQQREIKLEDALHFMPSAHACAATVGDIATIEALHALFPASAPQRDVQHPLLAMAQAWRCPDREAVERAWRAGAFKGWGMTAIFPLAVGVPGRAAQLRGYGNSIVPQLAALRDEAE